MPAVTGITAHSAVYCFGLTAPPETTVRFMCYLQELGAAELAALFFLRLQSLKGAEEVLTIHHYPKSSKT